MAAPDFPLHEKIQGLSWILGEWSGQGEGHYPTIPSFKYMETITFTHAGKPVIAYSQKTRKLMEDGSMGPPMHAESGFLRPSPGAGPHGFEMVIAQGSGLAEVQKGPYDAEARTFTFHSSVVGNATKVLEIQRTMRHDEGADAIMYEVGMSTVDQPMQEHLRATPAVMPSL